jgi:hypothetical protein
MTDWQPIATCPPDEPVLIGRRGERTSMAEMDKCTGEFWTHLDGEFYGTRSSLTPTHWAKIDEPPQ